MKIKTVEETNYTILLEAHLSSKDYQEMSNHIIKNNLDIQAMNEADQQKKVTQLSMQAAIHRYLTKHPQELLWEPTLNIKSHDDEGLIFNCKMDKFPTIHLPESYQVKVEVPEVLEPQKEDVMSAIESLQVHFGEKKEVQRPAQWGDAITLDVHVSCQNQIIPRSSQNRIPVFLKENEADDPFVQSLLGVEAGQSKTIELELGEDYPFSQFRGQSAQFHVKVHNIIELRVPEANDQFARVLEYGQTLEDMIEKLHQEIKEQHTVIWQNQVREQIVKAYTEQIDLSIPEEWVEREIFSTFLMSDYLILKEQNINDEELKNVTQYWVKEPVLLEETKQSLKTRFIMREVAKKENIEVTSTEIEEAIQASGGDKAQLEIMQQEGTLTTFINNLLVHKVAHFLTSKARLTFNGNPLEI